MAKKKGKKKETKKKDPKKKGKKKKDLKKGLKKKALKKKDNKKKKKDKKASVKKTTKGKEPRKRDRIEQITAADSPGDHSSNYNVQEAVKKLRTLNKTEDVQAFIKGEKRITITRAIQPVLNRIEKK
jgi:hypothetical protein